MAAGDGTVLTIAAARVQLGAGDETTDAELGDTIAAAEQAIADMLGRPLTGEGGWADQASVPANVVHAIKIAVTAMFDDRTGVLPETAIRSLIGRHMRISFG